MEYMTALLQDPWFVIPVALVFVFGRMILYFRRIMVAKKGFGSRPWLSEVLVFTGVALAVWSFFLSPGILGYVLAGLTVLAGSFVLFLFSQGGVPASIGVNVGEKAPAFQAEDWDGVQFAFEPGGGDALLLKFYRGHW